MSKGISADSRTTKTVGTPQPHAYPTSRNTFGLAVDTSASKSAEVRIRDFIHSRMSPVKASVSARSQRKPAACAAGWIARSQASSQSPWKGIATKMLGFPSDS